MSGQAYACPHCGKPVTSSAAPGQRIACSHCQATFKLPSAAEIASPKPSESPATQTVGHQIAFTCPLCDSRLYASPGEDRIVCPDCLESVEVPSPPTGDLPRPPLEDSASSSSSPSKPPASNHSADVDSDPLALRFDDDDELPLAPLDASDALPGNTAAPPLRESAMPRGPTESARGGALPDDDDELKLAPLDPLPEEVQSAATLGMTGEIPAGEPPGTNERPRRKARRFGVTCGVCDTRLDVSEEDIGTTIVCPDCDTPMVVEPPPPGKKLAEVQWDDDGDELKIAEAESLDVYKEMAQQAEQKAIEEEKKEIQKKRKTPSELPPNPLKQNVFRCFSHWRTWVVVVAMGAAHVIALLLLAGIIALAKANPAIATLLGLIIGSVVFLTAAVVTAYFGGIVLTDSAEGWDELQELPPFDLWEWLGEAAFMAMAVVYSVLPASLAALLVAAGLPLWFLAILSAISWFLLFPVVLLSMLENASLAGPYSNKIWSSVRRHRRPWKFFYGWTAAVVIATAVLWAIPLPVWLWPIVLGVATPIATVAYFRLLGRLAWWLSHLE